MKSMRVNKWAALRFVAAVSLVLLNGCSLFFPHPEKSINVIGDADTPKDGRCSLAVAQLRKSVPTQVGAAGSPTALIIHVGSSTAASRTIGSGDMIYFEASAPDGGPVPPDHSARYRIEGLDSKGATVVQGKVLMNGDWVALHDSQGLNDFELKENNKRVSLSVASRLVIYKIDVPDATRPTTCDEQIRDQDFVFLRVLDPSTWLMVSDAGVLMVRKGASGVGTENPNNPRCPREEERCRTDPRGGLVCAWVPVCAKD